jgi:excisionase family DNA binding protein
MAKNAKPTKKSPAFVDPKLPQLMTPHEVAHYLNVSKRHVQSMIIEGAMHVTDVSVKGRGMRRHAWRFRRVDVDKFAKSRLGIAPIFAKQQIAKVTARAIAGKKKRAATKAKATATKKAA